MELVPCMELLLPVTTRILPTQNSNIENAVYVCLRDTPGLMVFDIVHVIRYDLWNGIKRGIDRAEKEYNK